VRWDQQGVTPSAFSREKAEPSALSNVGHKFYDRMRRHGDTARREADVWGRRSDETAGAENSRNDRTHA